MKRPETQEEWEAFFHGCFLDGQKIASVSHVTRDEYIITVYLIMRNRKHPGDTLHYITFPCKNEEK